ncbi:MAG: GHKL domain-containing protein [Planctomycetes bacterium]|nr:GHKL domain-containing protein [Planctomycetota bacterium]MBL7186701.1 GHKL domain-containing protein [Phycisphaerae bacterium]
MEPVPEDIRLLKGAYWLTRLRWIAIVCIPVGTYVCGNVLGIALREIPLYAVATLLFVYNVAILVMLDRAVKADQHVSPRTVKGIIHLQICADLILLTVLLHFSGGIENPLVFFFIFHMIIAGILLSPRESYLQATFAVLLFGLLVLLEHKQYISHYCLEGFVPHCLQEGMLYILGTFLVFATGLYVAVYMANYIAIRLKHTERAYRQANVMLQEKDRIKDEYVSRVTHDIKGHLATIQGCLAVVVDRMTGKLDAQEADLISRAHARSIKLTNFVRALLRLTQMRLSNKLEKADFSMGEALRSATGAVEAKAGDKSITLNCNIDSSADKVFGNQFSIEEMVTNLLLNAIKYTPANGTIDVSAGSDETSVLVKISDTGIGIPKEEQARVFDEFYRATNARKAERDGTGLGLSIVKYIVERHEGQIQVESEEGCGTTFKLTLPRTA